MGAFAESFNQAVLAAEQAAWGDPRYPGGTGMR
jgi:hypothetical protein